MNRDLFLAILALDSYNRGYDVRLDGLPSSGSLGLASIASQSDVSPDSEAVRAGFYAIAYEWNGETVISYRGTDEFFQDAVNGYAVGAGFTGIFAPQGELALEFYSNVTGQSFKSTNVLDNLLFPVSVHETD